MKEHVPDVDLRFVELQKQIDRLTVTLQRWQPPEQRAGAAEARLAEIVEKCAESFVEAIEQQGRALRAVHAEPVHQLQEQAANLEESAIAAANLALRGFERAEQRVASLEADIQNRMAQLSRQIEQALVELRGAGAHPARALPSDVSPFPLESVMRIHEEVRRADTSQGTAADRPTSPDLPAGRRPLGLPVKEPQSPRPPPATPLDGATESASEAAARAARPLPNRRHIWQTAALAAVAVTLVILGFYFLRRVDAQLDEASARIAAAEQRAEHATALASREIASTRDEAEKRIAEARHTARQADVVSQILAAPDLTRFNLSAGGEGPRAYGHVLWSRSRGFVFSASRLPPAPKGSTYQLWFSSGSGSASGGTFEPDSAGRATLATDEPPAFRQAVSGVVVTIEKAGGATAPTGTAVLTRVQ